MAFNVPGLLSIIFFYIVILAVGIWAGRKAKAPEEARAWQPLSVVLAGRNTGIFVGIFSMTATCVCGGYINGIAEILYTRGLIWCQAPFGFAISLILGGQLFAVKMHDAGYRTMLDPFQKHYGAWMGCLLFVPALCGEILRSSAILAALGGSVQVMLELEEIQSVLLSACFALFYTLSGGTYTVAYTDSVQLVAIFVGLWVCVPYIVSHRAVGKPSYPSNDYIGTFDSKHFASYWDRMLSLMMGRLPWQLYLQRVVSSKSSEEAELLSYMASLGCFFMAVPPIVIGAVARVANFTTLGYPGRTPLRAEEAMLVLPLSLRYLPPPYVSAIGLGAFSAAVMSSLDSSILSASSVFAWNVYKLTLRQSASEDEVNCAMRMCVILVGALAALIALSIKSVYYLWYLSSDFVYVILFPQLVSVVYLKEHCNAYGAVAAYLVGITFRTAGGEPRLGIPTVMRFPFYSPTHGQLFPFRTFSMIASFTILISMSMVFKAMFDKLPPKYDILNCFVEEREAEASKCRAAAKATRARRGSIGPRQARQGSSAGSDAGKPQGTRTEVRKEQRKSLTRTSVGSIPVYEATLPVEWRSPSDSEEMKRERRRSFGAGLKSRRTSRRLSTWQDLCATGTASDADKRKSRTSRGSLPVYEAKVPVESKSSLEGQEGLKERRRSSAAALRAKETPRPVGPRPVSYITGTGSDAQNVPGPGAHAQEQEQKSASTTSRGSLPGHEATMPVESKRQKTQKKRRCSSAAQAKSKRDLRRASPRKGSSTTGMASSAEGPPGPISQLPQDKRKSIPRATRGSIPIYEATMPAEWRSSDESDRIRKERRRSVAPTLNSNRKQSIAAKKDIQ